MTRRWPRHHFRWWLTVGCAWLTCCLASGPVRADEGPTASTSPPAATAPDRIVYQNLVAGRGMPAGLVDRFQIGYRRQLVQKYTPLWQDSQASAKFDTTVTPAYATAGAVAEVQPLTVFRVAARYQWIGYFGTFGNVLSYPSPLDEYDPARRKAATDAGDNYVTSGHLVDVATLLQAKAGPVIVRSELVWRYLALDLRNGDRVYFDQYLDVVVPNRGSTLLLDTDVLGELGQHLLVGARYSLVAPLYRDRHYRPDEPLDNPNGPISRLGPAALYRIFDRPGSRFDAPSIVLITQWHLRHRYRVGSAAVMHPAVPTVIAGLLFKGTLWHH